jgi:hypothetical protein
MAKKYAVPVVNDPKPEQQPKSKLKPPQWFGRYRIQVSPDLPKKGRCLYLLRQLCRKETPCWASVKYLANQLDMKPAEVRRYKSLAVTAGWLEPTTYKGRKALKRVKASIKESNDLWRSLVDLKTNAIVTITDLVSSKEDYKIQISLKALAAKCHAHHVNLGKAIKGLEELKLLEVQRKKSDVNVYSIPVKRTESSARKVAGRSSQEILAQGGFTDRVVESLTEIIKAAKRLQLFDLKTEAELTVHILDLYDAMKGGREAANLSTNLKIKIGGPLEILRRYMAWLVEKDWEASSKVLKLNSPSFASFRRDFRSLEGIDPIDGKEKVYER